jgi:hypothetical protein
LPWSSAHYKGLLEELEELRPGAQWLSNEPGLWNSCKYPGIDQDDFEGIQDRDIVEQIATKLKDAVDICRRLEINFMWIDSLCIIQDDYDGWKAQAMKMRGVYENAMLTIAAIKSKDSLGGGYITTDLKLLGKQVPGTGIYIRKRPQSFPTLYGLRYPEEWPLMERGWI